MGVEGDVCFVPNQLCQYCRHFFHVFDRRISEHGLEYHRNTEAQGLEHLPDVQFLLESARDGCHLCSILAGRLKDAYGQDPLHALGSDSLFLTLKKAMQPNPSLRRYILELYNWRVMTNLWCDSGPLMKTHLDVCNCKTVIMATSSRESRPFSNCGSQKFQDGLLPPVGFDRQLRLVKSWIDQCTTTHEECKTSPRPARPTRLLDLGCQMFPSTIRVVDGFRTVNELYATLSYRWGSKLPLMLLPSNVESFKAGIRYDLLPKTFKDAIAVCHKLSIRYLWIDALCIMQGPAGDFETEAAKMGSIYAGSFLTIAAAEAPDSWEGFINEMDPLQQEDCWHQLKQSGCTVRISSGVQRKYLGEYSLDGRGWVFQERLFSPRSLYFSPHGVEWECRQSTATTDKFVPSEDIYVMGQLSKRLYGQLTRLKRLWHPKDLAVFQRLWNDVVMQYTQTSLTYASDKLPALAGIATIAEEKFKAGASFGLWLRGFTSELLWITQDGGTGRRIPGRAPTWSWASIEGAVEKHHITGSYEISIKEREYTAKVVVAPPPTSFISPSVARVPIKLRAPLAPCIFHASDSFSPWRFGCDIAELSQDATAYVDEQGVYRMRSFYWDIALKSNQRLVCLLVKRIIYSERRGKSECLSAQSTKVVVEDVGLVLAPTGAHCRQYERVGLYNESAEMGIPHWRNNVSAEIWSAIFLQLTGGLRMFRSETGLKEISVEIV